MAKIALFAFNGEPMCFVHVLLNAFDFQARGDEVKVVIEGSATKLVKSYADDPELPFAALYHKAHAAGLLAEVCQACAAKMGSLEAAKAQGIPLGNDMKGHPSLARFLAEGYQVFTF